MRSQVVDLRRRSSSPSPQSRPRLPLRDTPKRETLRTKRRRRRLVILAVSVVLLLGVGYGISYASYLPKFTIQSFEVQGAKELQPEVIRTQVEAVVFDGISRLFSRANIFLYPKTEIETSLKEKFPRIESTSISREALFATTVLVSIKERESFARWCPSTSLGAGELGGTCYLIDRAGYVFAPYATSTNTVSPYVFHGELSATTSPLGQTYLPGKLSSLLALADQLGQDGFTPREVSVEGKDFSISFGQGFELRASFGVNVAELVRDLDLVLTSDSLRDKQSQLEYIDLRFGNRVYYKLKGEGPQTQ